MSDRFRFRAWNFYANQMDYDSKYGLEEWLELEGLDAGFGVVSVMQCTGLKDKNGKLIYEGDIIINRVSAGSFAKETLRTVEFGEHSTSSDYYASLAYGWYCRELRTNIDEETSLMQVYDEIEIVGNIYENKELLK